MRYGKGIGEAYERNTSTPTRDTPLVCGDINSLTYFISLKRSEYGIKYGIEYDFFRHGLFS